MAHYTARTPGLEAVHLVRKLGKTEACLKVVYLRSRDLSKIHKFIDEQIVLTNKP
jgi:hypothetical protein